MLYFIVPKIPSFRLNLLFEEEIFVFVFVDVRCETRSPQRVAFAFRLFPRLTEASEVNVSTGGRFYLSDRLFY